MVGAEWKRITASKVLMDKTENTPVLQRAQQEIFVMEDRESMDVMVPQHAACVIERCLCVDVSKARVYIKTLADRAPRLYRMLF
jgi:hypothetical protein